MANILIVKQGCIISSPDIMIHRMDDLYKRTLITEMLPYHPRSICIIIAEVIQCSIRTAPAIFGKQLWILLVLRGVHMTLLKIQAC